MEYRVFNVVLAVVLVLILVAPLAIVFSDGSAWVTGMLVPKCQILARTGHECEGCGLTRSVLALYQGQWQLSRQLHWGGSIFVGVISAELVVRLVAVFVRPSQRLFWLDLTQLLVVVSVWRLSLTL
ncbi:MAG: hypothetical protein RL701_3679 [Pseudomonadota bacterium]|jgi:hypothetical protein